MDSQLARRRAHTSDGMVVHKSLYRHASELPELGLAIRPLAARPRYIILAALQQVTSTLTFQLQYSQNGKLITAKLQTAICHIDLPMATLGRDDSRMIDVQSSMQLSSC